MYNVGHVYVNFVLNKGLSAHLSAYESFFVGKKIELRRVQRFCSSVKEFIWIFSGVVKVDMKRYMTSFVCF